MFKSVIKETIYTGKLRMLCRDRSEGWGRGAGRRAYGGEAGGNLGVMDTFPVLCRFHAHVCQSQQIICSAGVLCCTQIIPE